MKSRATIFPLQTMLDVYSSVRQRNFATIQVVALLNCFQWVLSAFVSIQNLFMSRLSSQLNIMHSSTIPWNLLALLTAFKHCCCLTVTVPAYFLLICKSFLYLYYFYIVLAVVRNFALIDIRKTFANFLDNLIFQSHFASYPYFTGLLQLLMAFYGQQIQVSCMLQLH